MKKIVYPSFYDEKKIGSLYLPDTLQAVAEGQKAGLTSSSEDKRRVRLLLVDTQVDFIHRDGSLAVPGALDDTKRTIEFIFKNADEITSIAASLDTHTLFQIFYPTWWVNERGEHPAPFTMITLADVKRGIWRPLTDPVGSIKYLEELEEKAKKVLMIWPFHTMVGTPGHAIVPSLFEAIVYHGAARNSQPTWLIKGMIPQTEHYSILEPEVKIPKHPMGSLNTSFLDDLARYDIIYVAGQAKSHCVLETMISITRYFKDQSEVIAKIRFLMDCTSSVQHPDIDFEAMANQQLKEMEKLGVQLVESTDPIK
jgi:nicotinamidase-related amidase